MFILFVQAFETVRAMSSLYCQVLGSELQLMNINIKSSLKRGFFVQYVDYPTWLISCRQHKFLYYLLVMLSRISKNHENHASYLVGVLVLCGVVGISLSSITNTTSLSTFACVLKVELYLVKKVDNRFKKKVILA